MCPHTTIYVPSYIYMSSYLSSYKLLTLQLQEHICVLMYIYVLILLYICPHTTICVSSCVLIYMCPHSTSCVLILLYMCPHTTIYVSSCYDMCPAVSSYICPHTTSCVSLYYYVCVLILFCNYRRIRRLRNTRTKACQERCARQKIDI